MKTTISWLTGVLTCVMVHAENTSYFIDSKQGRDTASGLSEKRAWKTLANVNALTFGPGDKVLLTDPCYPAYRPSIEYLSLAMAL